MNTILRIAWLAALAHAALAQTTVADTVSLRPGVNWTGTVTISWPAFTTLDARAIAAGQTQTTVKNGALAVSLWPSVGATWPAVGLSAAGPYTAVYNTTEGPDRGHTWQEIWNVPATSPASLADVRKASSLSGNTIYSGTTVPADATGMKGDFYIRNPSTAPCMFGPKQSATWPGTCVTLVGTTGAPGIIQSGSAPPSNGVGADGQFYIDAASCMWGPKASGAWPGSCTSLIGPPGGVNSFKGRTGAVTPQTGDYDYLYASAASKAAGYYCVQVSGGGAPSLVQSSSCPGAGSGGTNVGLSGGATWAAVRAGTAPSGPVVGTMTWAQVKAL